MEVGNQQPDISVEAEQMLTDEVPYKQIQNAFKNEFVTNEKNKDAGLIKNVNNKVLIDFLSPEIKNSENAKRKHKYILITLLSVFLVLQFYSVSSLSSQVIGYATADNADIEIVNSLLTFVSAYITSVVVELIAILNYIVKNVFDTSLAELVKIFKETELPSKEE